MTTHPTWLANLMLKNDKEYDNATVLAQKMKEYASKFCMVHDNTLLVPSPPPNIGLKASGNILAVGIISTGGCFRNDEIVGLAVAVYNYCGYLIDFYHLRFRNVRSKMVPSQIRSHGVVESDLKCCLTFRQQANQLRHLFQECVGIIGYDIDRTIEFLQTEFTTASIQPLETRRYAIVDIKRLWEVARYHTPHRYTKWNSLDDIYRLLCNGRTYRPRHNPCGDVIASLVVLESIMEWYDLRNLQVDKLHWFLRDEQQVDYYGNFKWNKDGVVVFANGDQVGEPVCQPTLYGHLMVRKRSKTNPYDTDCIIGLAMNTIDNPVKFHDMILDRYWWPDQSCSYSRRGKRKNLSELWKRPIRLQPSPLQEHIRARKDIADIVENQRKMIEKKNQENSEELEEQFWEYQMKYRTVT